MGCSASRLEDEEAVQMCKDRRNFIKQAIEQRIRFASGHITYIQSLKRVSRALCDFVDGHEHYDSFSDSFTTPPFTPVKKLSPEIIGIPFKSSASALNQPEKIIGVPFRSSASTQNRSRESTLHIARYLRSGGSTSVSVEELEKKKEFQNWKKKEREGKKSVCNQKSRLKDMKFFHAAPSSGYDGYESSSDYSQESCMISGSHQSTLDRLYEWEKKLYEEVKEMVGSFFIIIVGFSCCYLLDAGEWWSVGSKRHRITSVQLASFAPRRRLAKMWRTTADCHRIQKRTIDEAKLLILASAAAGKASEEAAPQPRNPRAVAALEAELRNWRACLEAWVAAQRAYARALAGWALRCGDPGGGGARSPLSPPRPSGGAPAVLGLCVQWSRLLESVGEAQVVDGLDFFAAGIGSVSGRAAAEEDGEGDDAASPAAMATAEMARRVLCAGMSVAVSSLADFAARSAEGYEVLVRWGGDRRAES
ncbi:hypothetical protein BHE74_00026380 [Ensete ventricosum]|nr:hypothetical protein BHE74_00026380 [Ensete ventricosum]